MPRRPGRFVRRSQRERAVAGTGKSLVRLRWPASVAGRQGPARVYPKPKDSGYAARRVGGRRRAKRRRYPDSEGRRVYPYRNGIPASLLRQIKAAPRTGVFDGLVMIWNCAMRFTAALLALAVVSAPLAARAAD